MGWSYDYKDKDDHEKDYEYGKDKKRRHCD